jgi:dipeptidase D
MLKISSLEPNEVWMYFEEICKIPRPSKKEMKIRDYLQEFAKKHNLKYKSDDAGNILISKHACHGREKIKTVILQSHLDMVCEKNSDISHNFEKDGIQSYIDGDWIRAKGTTLGADD